MSNSTAVSCGVWLSLNSEESSRAILNLKRIAQLKFRMVIYYKHNRYYYIIPPVLCLLLNLLQGSRDTIHLPASIKHVN